MVKAIIALAGLLAVTPQISYKFFLCANLPAGAFKAHHRAPHVAQVRDAGSGSRLAHERHHRLSIDKRYTAKHLFALPSIAFALTEQPLPSVSPVLPRPLGSSDPLLVAHRLRGPPAWSTLSPAV